MRTPDTCACTCNCPLPREEGCNDLCADCWASWSAPLEATDEHAPKADRSYLGTYGIAGVWTWWIANQGAGHLLARPFHALLTCGRAPVCPAALLDDTHHMLRRPDGWKCYRHDELVVIMDEYDIPPTPQVTVLRAGGHEPRKEIFG